MATRVVSLSSGEAHDVCVTRPGPYGNPFSHLPRSSADFRCSTAEEAVVRHREWLKGQTNLVAEIRRDLRGKILACACLQQPCHAYTIAEVADADTVCLDCGTPTVSGAGSTRCANCQDSRVSSGD